MDQISTIGYEGTSIEIFIETLLAAQISYLVDVRAVPVSRKKGFSKRQLEARLSKAGISYVSLKGLGDPKPGRDAARAGQYAEFRRIYRTHLQTDVAQADLNEAITLATKTNVCILCYEKNPTECHRSIVAGEMRRLGGLEVQHLYVGGLKDGERPTGRGHAYPSESHPTTEC